MSSVYTDIAKKRIEQSQEASQPTKKSTENQNPPVEKNESQKDPAKADQKLSQNVKKPEIMKTRNHENDSPIDLPVKYSTLLRTHFIKRIKIHAAETELKDYEVIELALTEFFKKH